MQTVETVVLTCAAGIAVVGTVALACAVCVVSVGELWRVLRPRKPTHNDQVATQVASELADAFLVADCERMEKRARFMSTAQKKAHRSVLSKRLKTAITRYEAAKGGAKP